jgi:SagB-type dehydrogenase family enzyme
MFEVPPSDHDVLERMEALDESLTYYGYPTVSLEPVKLPTMPLAEAILRRSTAKKMTSKMIDLDSVSALLHAACGVTRDERSRGFPRAFRTTPSGGAMYPLELYFYSARTEHLESGLYHFNPSREELRLLRRGDLLSEIEPCLVQGEVARTCSMIVFITALFDRSTFKYGDRGYRFALIEAGHVAQNLNLTAAALDLGSINLGGFYDRRVDDLLDLDGLTHSAIYIVAIGEEEIAGQEIAEEEIGEEEITEASVPAGAPEAGV